MKKSIGYKIWQVLYPIGIYYVVSSIAYFFLGMLIGNAQETYMLRQMICGAITIPFIMSFYKQDKQLEDTVYGKERITLDAKTIRNIILSVATGAMLGIAVNNIIAMTPLVEVSAGFKEANSSFFAGDVLFELLGSCLIIPIAEELLYRGVVYKRLRLLFGAAPAVIVSAVIFGAMHVNLVQFLYAGILGLLLAYLLQSTHRIYAPILAHMAANVAAVIRQETGWLDFAYEPTMAGIGVSVLLLAIAAAMLYLDNRRRNSQAD